VKHIYIFIAIALIALSAVSCKNDRGTVMNFPFFGVDNTAKDITSFAINGYAGVINENETKITVILPCDTNITDLAASFTHTGKKIEVNEVEQLNGITHNDYTNPVTFTVFANDESTKSYTVHAYVPNYEAKAITAFSINGHDASIVGTNISLELPYGTNLTSLVATFTFEGKEVTVGGAPQESGITINDFSGIDPVIYTVEACNGTTINYSVVVTEAPSDAKEITSFSINGVPATIEGTNITLTLKCTTNLTNLIATFNHNGQTVTVDDVPQVSGTTANNFTTPKTYIVRAANGTTQSYIVTVSLSTDNNKNFTSFSINGKTGLINNDNHTISLVLDCGTDRSSLVAIFTTNGRRVLVGENVQQSGSTTNNFTGPVTYTVEACDGSSVEYEVTATVAGNSAASINLFGIKVDGTTWGGNIVGTNISVTLPCGTDLTSLIATFNYTGYKVFIDAVEQQSGTTANNFTSQVTYTVQACDGTPVNYYVTVTTGDSTKTFNTFTIPGAISSTIDNNARTIHVELPCGTDRSSLVASFSIQGYKVFVNNLEQASGTTTNNFNGTVTYTVQACDRSTVNYAVSVTRGNSDASIDTFSIDGNTGTIDHVNHTISVELPCGTDRSSLVADFTKTGYKVFVDTVEQESGVTENNFNGDLIYKVVSCDETIEQNYTVSATIDGGDSKDITAFSFNEFYGAIFAGTFDGTNISVTLPSGTDTSNLAATFATTTNNEVTVDGAVQTSGASTNDFSGDPVAYIVHACDLSIKQYSVSVTLAPPPNISSFVINEVPGTFTTAAGVNYIDLTLPGTPDLTNLIAEFTTTNVDDYVLVGDDLQTSGATINDFTNPVTYTVYTFDASSYNDYIVTVVAAP
jgi:hypothetical protein